jgi:hypothetical protein
MKRTLVLLLPLALLVLTGIALADATLAPSVNWQAIGGGGGHLENGMYAVDYTVGQPVVGTSSSGIYEVCAGFLCGTDRDYHVFLPLVLKDA